jgi:hypothetical protein
MVSDRCGGAVTWGFTAQAGLRCALIGVSRLRVVAPYALRILGHLVFNGVHRPRPVLRALLRIKPMPTRTTRPALRGQTKPDRARLRRRDQLPTTAGQEACRIAIYLPGADVTNTSKHSVDAEWLIGTHARFRHAIEAARAPSPPISRARATVTEAPPGAHPVAFAASPCPEDDPFHQLRGRTRRGTCRSTRRPAWDRRSGYGAGTGERLPAAGGARWTF